MNEPLEHPIVAEALKGDLTALACVRMIALILHTWDDLVDRDGEVTDADINRAFTLALVSLPRNPFYREHFEEFNALLFNAIINWRIATDTERAAVRVPGDLEWAYISRSTYVDLVVLAAVKIGGIEWGVEKGPAIRRWAHAERFGGYLDNLAAEAVAREKAHVL